MTICRDIRIARNPRTIAAGDTETASNGLLLDVNLAYYVNGDLHYDTCRTWEEWLECVKVCFQTTDAPCVYFHNGGNFDFVGFAKLALSGVFNEQISDFKVMLIDTCILQVSFKIVGLKRVVKLADSFRLMPRSLAELGGPKGFNMGEGNGKISIPDYYKGRMEEYRRFYAAEYHAYHKRDTVLLLDILHVYRDTVNEIAPIGDLPLTVGSTAMRVYKKAFIPADLEIVTPGEQERAFTLLCYQGGRTEYVGDGGPDSGTQTFYSGVNGYDINSEYPAMMAKFLYPTRPGTYTRTDKHMRGAKGIILPGCYHCTFKQAHGAMAVLKPKNSLGVVSEQAAWTGETYATYLELREIEAYGGTVDLIEGYVYPEKSMLPIFKEFVDTLYARRLKAEAAGNEALKYVIKLVLNNLYGKFAERSESTSFEMLTPQQRQAHLQKGTVITPLPDLSDDAFAVKGERVVMHAFPAIAAFITAAGRLTLLEPANHHGIKVVYCDTDSVYTRDHLPASFIDEHELGKFKCETTKHPNGIRMQIAARKMYINHSEGKIKSKGISPSAFPTVKEKNATSRAIETGTPYEAAFLAPTKLKTCLNRNIENPNEFLVATRTINRKSSTYALGLLRRG